MKAILCATPGGPEALTLDDTSTPEISATEVLIRVRAAGVNRADLLQRQGLYPPPRGESDILGLECSGRVVQVGPDVAAWNPGDEVCALLTGGGYAEYVAAPQGQVMPVPAGLDPLAAAGLPEVACTVYSNLAMGAQLSAGEWLLIHGGGSGIGTFAIQWAKAIGANVVVTAGSAEKLRRCRELGADAGINYREQDFPAAVRELTENHGADVILDIIGAKYLEANVRTLARGGRLVVIGLQGGTRAELDLGRLLSKAGSIQATSLRARPAGEKSEICARVVEQVWPMVADGRIKVVVDRVVGLPSAAEAHTVVAAGEHVGKVVLQVSGDQPHSAPGGAAPRMGS
jgi:putative PIG3 family NAD(P)H quinone oxidoreductase